jgi:hypothetical protein
MFFPVDSKVSVYQQSISLSGNRLFDCGWSENIEGSPRCSHAVASQSFGHRALPFQQGKVVASKVPIQKFMVVQASRLCREQNICSPHRRDAGATVAGATDADATDADATTLGF